MTHFFVFFVPGDLDLLPFTLTFQLGRDFCTAHLTAKFHRPKFNRSVVIVLTSKQTDKLTTDAAKTSILLRYATPMGKLVHSSMSTERAFDVDMSVLANYGRRME